MYIPSAHAVTDLARLHDFMRRHGFATLVTQGEEGLIATHLPLLLDVEGGSRGQILGHMARANPQWRRARGEALAIFSGPHAYISPSWYEAEGTVPTWNYAVVHAYGPFEVIEDRETLHDILRRSVRTHEDPRPQPWSFDETAPHVDGLLKAIVGFRIPIVRLEGKWKMSQNHPEERRRRVIRALLARPDEDSQAVARMVAEALDGPGSSVIEEKGTR
jgi:transcriptional regulator